MAVIDTDEKFALAASTHPEAHVYQGSRFVDRTARKIFDQVPDPDPEAPPGKLLNIDVTPSQVVLEAALDTALAQIAAEQALAAALAALETGRGYLQTLLDNPTPITLTTAVNNIKPVVDANVFLTQWMTRYLNTWNNATTLAVSMNPNTDALRARYILALADIISIRRPVG